MAERVWGLLVLLAVCTALWYLIFNKKARQRLYQGAWLVRRMNRSQGGMYDSFYLAILLLFNFLLTLLFVVSLVNLISEWVKG